MIGQTISHYQILEKLDQGGMGVVYKAEDTRLKRMVALKFLLPQFTLNDEAKERFLHEAQAASALSHQNICAIHDIDETDEGQIFIVMDCYEGETLKQKIQRGPLSIEESRTIAMQIAEGLSQAHEKNIVHRDIKSSNIFITSDGVVKILDFGLAKLDSQTQLTKTGTTIGTVAYMSPEQAMGQSVDHRTDIWSLGVILYEMIASRLPFKGEYEQAVIYSILNETPQPLSTSRPEVPLDLIATIDACLQKAPSARYQSAHDLYIDLMNQGTNHKAAANNVHIRKRRQNLNRAAIILLGIALLAVPAVVIFKSDWASEKKPPSSAIKRLVVLPFENLGPVDNEYFTDGMTEELTARLAALSGLGVISRTSAIQYAKTDKTIEQIGRELNVDYALEGTVRWAPAAIGADRVRITPHLLQISSKITLWAETYDRVMDDIFQVQSEISQKVVEKMGITLLEPEQKSIDRMPTENLDAYQAYLRARFYEARPHFTLQNWLQVIEGYQQAVNLDPGFATAFAELARAHARLYFLWEDHSPERLDMASRAAAQALTLAPESPAVHLALGYYQLYAFRNTQKALQEFSIAEKGMPNNAELLQAKGAIAALTGDWEKAAACSRKALELSPRDGSIAVDLAECYWLLRRYEEAFAISNLAIELSPDDPWPYLYKVYILWDWKGVVPEARTMLEAVPPDHAFASWTRYWQNMCERKYNLAVEQLFSMPDEWVHNKCWAIPKTLLAGLAHERMGQTEQALQAYQSACSVLEERVAQQPDDPRYHSSLGIAYANLQRKDEAIREGKKAVELLPISADAFYGIPYEEDLAYIYLLVGETEAALERLDHLLSIPSWISVPYLEMNPRWDVLAKNPKFIRMMKKYRPR